jgi:hypothetical protein
MDRRKLATISWPQSLGMIPRRSVMTSCLFGKGFVDGEGSSENRKNGRWLDCAPVFSGSLVPA